MDAKYAGLADDVIALGLGGFLNSLQLADSFFPSGIYALSYGLEAFVQAKALNPAELESLLADYLRAGVGPSDGAALACAHQATEENAIETVAEADRRLTAVKLPREMRETSQRTGRQLLTTVERIFGGTMLRAYAERAASGAVPSNHAIVLGLTMAELGIPREQALAGELYAFTASAVASLVRLAVIDYRFAQIVVHNLKHVIADVTRVHCESCVRDIANCTPRIDIMSMHHERAELRLFMS